MATIAEVAAALGVAPEAIERAIAQGKIGRGDLGTLAGDGPPPPPAADGITPAAPGEVELQVGMNYPGKYISVNHCYRKGQGGRLHLRREAFVWRRNLKVALDWALVEQGIRAALAGPVTIRIDAEYVDPKHGTDIDNLFKLTWDAAKVALGVDDREFQPETGTVVYGVAVPNLTITVRCRLAGTTTPAGPKPRRARTQG